jgi:hypothetical protein
VSILGNPSSRKRRKVTRTYLSSIPHLREFLTEYGYGAGRAFPRRLADFNGDYETQLQTWLKTYDWSVDAIRRQDPYDERRRLGPDETYEERETREDSDRKEMLDWIAQITTECDWTLRRLFDRYQLSPIYVLDILAFWKAHLVFYRRAIEGSKYLRSAKHREQHSKVLLKAAEILELWKPISSYTFSMLSFPEPRELRFIAKTLQGAGASQSHRPENIELKKCARDLSELFKRKTSLRLPEYVGELLRAAFPDMWNPASRVLPQRSS